MLAMMLLVAQVEGLAVLHRLRTRLHLAPDELVALERSLALEAVGVASLQPGDKRRDMGRTARDGTIECVAKAVHLGKTTQVWDSVVTHRETGKTIALFRCTQLVLYPKA